MREWSPPAAASVTRRIYLRILEEVGQYVPDGDGLTEILSTFRVVETERPMSSFSRKSGLPDNEIVWRGIVGLQWLKTNIRGAGAGGRRTLVGLGELALRELFKNTDGPGRIEYRRWPDSETVALVRVRPTCARRDGRRQVVSA